GASDGGRAVGADQEERAPGLHATPHPRTGPALPALWYALRRLRRGGRADVSVPTARRPARETRPVGLPPGREDAGLAAGGLGPAPSAREPPCHGGAEHRCRPSALRQALPAGRVEKGPDGKAA